jgi:ACS family hexuronate transporter-like MFS transporter
MPFPKLRGLRWWVISLLTFGAIVNYLTRSTLANAAPTMLTELQITPQQYSWILNAFQVGIMLQPFCGYVFDVIGLRAGFIIFTLAWSVLSICHGFARTWPQFALLRGLLGFAEGSSNPGGMKAISEWFPGRERGFATGIYNIGATFGSMLAPPLVVWAILYYNWQSAFMITGCLGLVWTALWIQLYQSPTRHPRLSTAERDHIVAGQEPHLEGDGSRPSVLQLLRQRNFWGIALAKFLADPTWSMLTFWLPLYLSSVRHFNLKEIAMTAWLPFLSADLGCLSGGMIVLALQKRGVGLINARRGAFTVGAIMMTSMACVGLVESPYAAIALLCVGGFAQQTVSVTVLTMATDLFKRNEVATVTGMMGTCSNAGVLFFNLLIGAFVMKIGYTPFFIAVGLLDLVGAALLWLVVREPHRDTAPMPTA